MKCNFLFSMFLCHMICSVVFQSTKGSYRLTMTWFSSIHHQDADLDFCSFINLQDWIRFPLLLYDHFFMPWFLQMLILRIPVSSAYYFGCTMLKMWIYDIYSKVLHQATYAIVASFFFFFLLLPLALFSINIFLIFYPEGCDWTGDWTQWLF